MNFFQWLLSKIGFHYVLLIDHDGEINVRRCKRVGQYLSAWRYGLGVGRVILHPDGSVTGTNYVTAWEPLTWKQTFEKRETTPMFKHR